VYRVAVLAATVVVTRVCPEPSPGVILEYERRDGSRNTKIIDLLALTPESDLDTLVEQIIREEPLVSEARKPQLRRLLDKLVEKQLDGTSSRDFCEFIVIFCLLFGWAGTLRGCHADLFKVLRAHILPLTNCAFNKGGDRFITGSYDRTCKVWDTATGVSSVVAPCFLCCTPYLDFPL
jgi:dynein assembly factor with WDR repeat domains 1